MTFNSPNVAALAKELATLPANRRFSDTVPNIEAMSPLAKEVYLYFRRRQILRQQGVHDLTGVPKTYPEFNRRRTDRKGGVSESTSGDATQSTGG